MRILRRTAPGPRRPCRSTYRELLPVQQAGLREALAVAGWRVRAGRARLQQVHPQGGCRM